MQVVIELSQQELDKLMELTGYDIYDSGDAEEAIHIAIEYA